MKKSEMLQLLVNHYSGGNKAAFSRLVGISPQALSKWLERESFDHEAVFQHCEGVSPYWLLSNGNGEMLEKDRHNVYSGSTRELLEIINKLTALMNEQQDKYDKLLEEVQELRSKNNL